MALGLLGLIGCAGKWIDFKMLYPGAQLKANCQIVQSSQNR